MKQDVYAQVVSIDQTSSDAFEKQFQALLQKHNVDRESLTIESLREIVSDYLQTLILELPN